MQQWFQAMNGLLWVRLSERRSVEQMLSSLAPLNGHLECLEPTPWYAALRANQRCYIVQLPTDQCFSDAKKHIRLAIPVVSSVDIAAPPPVSLCACWDEGQSIR